jgi:hypothetical protein
LQQEGIINPYIPFSFSQEEAQDHNPMCPRDCISKSSKQPAGFPGICHERAMLPWHIPNRKEYACNYWVLKEIWKVYKTGSVKSSAR